MTEVRLVNRHTGSVVVVPAEKADGLAVLGFEAEKSTSKAPAKKSASSKSSK